MSVLPRRLSLPCNLPHPNATLVERIYGEEGLAIAKEIQNKVGRVPGYLYVNFEPATKNFTIVNSENLKLDTITTVLSVQGNLWKPSVLQERALSGNWRFRLEKTDT